MWPWPLAFEWSGAAWWSSTAVQVGASCPVRGFVLHGPRLINFFPASFEGGLFPHCTCRGDAPLEFLSLNVPHLPGR